MNTILEILLKVTYAHFQVPLINIIIFFFFGLDEILSHCFCYELIKSGVVNSNFHITHKSFKIF